MDRAESRAARAAGGQQTVVPGQCIHRHGRGRTEFPLFFQVEGDMVLKTVQGDRLIDVPIRQGEIFLLPAEVPHSPQRPAGTVGIVVERRRGSNELDGFSWYCEHCGHILHLERVAVRNIETQLPEIFQRFYCSVSQRTCGVCGTVMQAPGQ
jgi:3-hydroxyanthranilate 3,4-dioxygenase